MWGNDTREDSLKEAPEMSENSISVVSELKFEIVSARTINSPKKYVAYTVMVRKDSSVPDDYPSVIERRYTEFLELYTNLRQEFPAIFSSLAFPKKVLRGNFSPEIIESRGFGFHALLLYLVNNEKVRESASVINFLNKKELTEALQIIHEKRYNEALVLLENNFRLLNKLFTNRHPLVLRALCLLVACCDAAHDTQTLQFAQTALHRYEAVSDTDSLRYYVPLLQLCARLLQKNGATEDRGLLEERLGCMKRRGVKVDGCPSLLDAVLTDYTPYLSPETL